MVHSLGQLIKIIRQTQMEMVVDKLIEFSGGKDEELRDISSLGLSSGRLATASTHPPNPSLEDNHR